MNNVKDMFNQQYESPDKKEIEVKSETKDGKQKISTREVDNNSPLGKLQEAAKLHNVKIKDPNPNCKKQGCYGRGYTGFESGTDLPIPCSCMFPEKETGGTYDITSKMRRKQKLKQEKEIKKSMQKV